jgi:hypothetical protein
MRFIKLYKKFNEETKFHVERDLVNIEIIDDLKLILLELEDLNFETEIIVNDIRYTDRDVKKPEIIKSIQISIKPPNFNLDSDNSVYLLDVFERIRKFLSINNFDFNLLGNDFAKLVTIDKFNINLEDIDEVDDLKLYDYFTILSKSY